MANKPSRWEPFRGPLTLRNAMDRLFEESFVHPYEGIRDPRVEAGLSVDIYEKEDALVVKATVPGIKAEELDITIAGDVLNIKGETKKEETVKEEHYHRRELRYGSFCRSVRLPIEVQTDKADATFKDGILTLTFPKPEDKKPRSISVQVVK